MLTKIKSVPAGMNPAHLSETPPASGSSASAAEASVKGKQLLQGRTKARVESLTAELDAARRAFDQISHDSVADERLDAVAVADAMTQAEEKVRALEAALKVAMQRDEDAQAALKHAEMKVRREDARVILTRQQEAGRIVDQALDILAPAVCEIIRSSKEVTDLGNDELTRRTLDAHREFVVWLFRACQGMPGCRTGVEPFQTMRVKAPGGCLPTPDLVDEVIR